MQGFYYFGFFEHFEITNPIPPRKVEALLDRWCASLAPFPVGARQDEAALRRADDAVRRIFLSGKNSRGWPPLIRRDDSRRRAARVIGGRERPSRL